MYYSTILATTKKNNKQKVLKIKIYYPRSSKYDK